MNSQQEISVIPVSHANAFALSETIKIGTSVYIIERHFSGQRDIREAIYTAIQNEAFDTS